MEPRTPPTTGPAVIRGLEAIPPSVDSLLASELVVDEEDEGTDEITEFDAAGFVARALLNVVRASEESVGVADTSLWAIAKGVPEDSVGVVPRDAGLAEMATKLEEPTILDMENGFELEIALVVTTGLVFAAVLGATTGGIDVVRAREAADVVGGALTMGVDEGGVIIGAALVCTMVEEAAAGGGVLLVGTDTGGREVDNTVVWAVVDIDVVVAAAVVEATATLVVESPPACAIFGIAVHF